MGAEHCLWHICFVPLVLDPTAPKIFGFSEFIAALALLVLVWTIADVRYQFRVAVAPGALYRNTFAIIVLIGLLTLAGEVWRSQGWLVPRTSGINYVLWQGILGSLFFLTFVTWMWYAFVRPPVYGKNNAKRFGKELYRHILKGSSSDLAIIADELANSSKSLIKYAPEKDALRKDKFREVEGVAAEVLLLIADKKFCRAVVESSPRTALVIFKELASSKKYRIPLDIFAKNITNEALRNRDSFLFHESEGYESGLIGYRKPLSQTLYGNYELVEAVGSALDPDVWEMAKWDAVQWEAYCRAVLLTFKDYVRTSLGLHSYVLHRAIGNIEHAPSDLRKLDGVEEVAWGDSDILKRLHVVVDFIKDLVKILDENEIPKELTLRVKVRNEHSVYDLVAGMIFEIIFAASYVKRPFMRSWDVQHNAVWSSLFHYDNLAGPAGKVIKFKVRRLLYNEVCEMKEFPNFKGANILGFCINVMGLARDKNERHKDTEALHKAILCWTKAHYVWLHSYHSRVAEACLVDRITYEPDKLRLVRTNPAEHLRREPIYQYLNLEPEPAPAKSDGEGETASPPQ